MDKHRISEESTVYHYTLLYKFTRKHPFCWGYGVLWALWLLTDLILGGSDGAFWFAVSGIMILVLHAIVVWMLRRFARGTVPAGWRWAFSYPFYGYLPSGYVPASAWMRANRHRLFIGLVLIGLLYVWLPFFGVANLAAAHYLALLPQLVYVRKCSAMHRQSLIKINKKDISCYKN